jgi:hypothetical protein
MTTQILPITTLLKNPKWVQDQVQQFGASFDIVSNSKIIYSLIPKNNITTPTKIEDLSKFSKITIDDQGLKTYYFKNSKAKIIEKKVGTGILKVFSSGENKTTNIALNHNDIYDY